MISSAVISFAKKHAARTGQVYGACFLNAESDYEPMSGFSKLAWYLTDASSLWFNALQRVLVYPDERVVDVTGFSSDAAIYNDPKFLSGEKQAHRLTDEDAQQQYEAYRTAELTWTPPVWSADISLHMAVGKKELRRNGIDPESEALATQYGTPNEAYSGIDTPNEAYSGIDTPEEEPAPRKWRFRDFRFVEK